MKHFQRSAALLLILLTLLTMLPTAGLAAPKVKALKYNTWYAAQQPNPDSMTVYKLKLSAESVIYVSWKNASSRSGFAEVDFCRDVDCSYVVAGVEYYAPSSGKSAVVLYPGTYYVAIMNDVRGSKVKLSAMNASKLSPSNTASTRAISINAGKATEVIFDKKNSKPRWYKLRLTRNQAVTVFGNCSGLTMYDSKLKRIAVRQGWDSKKAVEKRTTKSKLAKGTYLIKVRNDMSVSECGSFYSFYWK